MTNASKRKTVAWALIIAPVLFFAISLLMGSACPSGQMFWALILASHMPCIALPFWAVFHGQPRLAVEIGWLMFFLGEVGFFAFYHTYYKKYGWPSPDIPAGIIVGLLFGWGIGWLITEVGKTTKQIVDRRWPIARHD